MIYLRMKWRLNEKEILRCPYLFYLPFFLFLVKKANEEQCKFSWYIGALHSNGDKKSTSKRDSLWLKLTPKKSHDGLVANAVSTAKLSESTSILTA